MKKLVVVLFSVEIVVLVCLLIGCFIFSRLPVDNSLSLKELPYHENVGPPSCTVITYNANDKDHEYIVQRLKLGISMEVICKKEIAKYIKAVGMYQIHSYGISSGAFIHRAGYILTNDHVLVDDVSGDPLRIVILWKEKYDGDLEIMEAEVIARNAPKDSDHAKHLLDLALLKIKKGQADNFEFPTIKFPSKPKDPSSIRLDQGIAITSPESLYFTTTTFEVSAIRKGQEINNKFRMIRNFKEDVTLLQLDASTITIGSSGGPLFNDRAEYIGMITAVVPRVSGIVFAIYVKDIIDWLREVEPSIILN